MAERDEGAVQAARGSDVISLRVAARVLLPGVFLAAALRVLLLMAEHTLPLAMGADRPVYDEVARSLAAGHAELRLLFLSPLYPLILAKTGSGSGLVFAQMCSGVLSTACIALLALRSSGRIRVGQVAGLLFAATGPLLFFETQVYPTSLSLCAALGGVLLCAFASSSPHRMALLTSAGSAFAVAVLLNPALLPLPFFVGLGFSLMGARPFGSRLALALALLAPLALAVLLTGLRNNGLEKGFAPLGANSGVTLAHGNQAESQGSYAPLPGSNASKRSQHADARREAARRLEVAEGTLRFQDSDRYWRNQSVAWVLAEPQQAAANFAHKARRLFFVDRLPLDTSWSYARSQASALRAAPLGWLALFLPALSFTIWRRSLSPFVAAALASITLCCLLFFPSERYRLPALAFACIPCAQFLDASWRRGGPVRLAALAAFASLALLTTLQATPSEAEDLARSNHADNLEWSGHLAAALELAREGYRRSPSAATADRVARILLTAERNREAQSFVENALAAGLESAALHNDRGLVLLRADHLAKADRAFQRALRFDPSFAAAHLNLGRLEERRRRPRYAAKHYLRYTELAPQDWFGSFAYARAANRSGDWNETAEAALQRSITRALGQPAALAQIFSFQAKRAAVLGDTAGAKTAFLKALHFDPESKAAQRGLRELAEPVDTP